MEPTDTPVADAQEPEVTEAPDGLRVELDAMKRQLEEQRAETERRIGGLLNANDKRLREKDDVIDRLTQKLEQVSEWQDSVTVQAMEPEERAEYEARRTRLRLEEVERSLAEREAQQRESEEREQRRAQAYTRAIKLGIPPEKIDHRSAETIEDSITAWSDLRRNEEVSELRKELDNLKKQQEASQSAAKERERADRGDTSVPDVGGASAGALNDPYDGLTQDQLKMVKAIETEMEKRPERRNSGLILKYQLELRRQGIEVNTSS